MNLKEALEEKGFEVTKFIRSSTTLQVEILKNDNKLYLAFNSDKTNPAEYVAEKFEEAYTRKLKVTNGYSKGG